MSVAAGRCRRRKGRRRPRHRRDTDHRRPRGARWSVRRVLLRVTAGAIVTLAAVALGVYAEPGAGREASLSNAEPWYIPRALLRQRRPTFRRLRGGASVGGEERHPARALLPPTPRRTARLPSLGRAACVKGSLRPPRRPLCALRAQRIRFVDRRVARPGEGLPVVDAE